MVYNCTNTQKRTTCCIYHLFLIYLLSINACALKNCAACHAPWILCNSWKLFNFSESKFLSYIVHYIHVYILYLGSHIYINKLATCRTHYLGNIGWKCFYYFWVDALKIMSLFTLKSTVPFFFIYLHISTL